MQKAAAHRYFQQLIILEQVDHCRSPETLSHPVLEGKPNANHVRARISNSRTQQLHNMDIITQCSNSIKKGNNSRLHHDVWDIHIVFTIIKVRKW
jgi:hypothetical protein